jgi:hypothetical protein
LKEDAPGDPDNPDAPVKTVGQKLIEAAVTHAAKGDNKFFQEIINRIDGKVPDRIVGAFNHGLLDQLEDEDLKAIISAAKEKGKADG